MKRCSRCRETKGVGEFGPHRRRLDGLQEYCRPCMRLLGREAYARSVARATAREAAGVTSETQPPRRCPRCGETKALAEYNRDRSSPDGRFPCCRACSKKIDHARYQKNPEKERQRRDAYRKADPERNRLQTRALYQKHREIIREKARAHYRASDKDRVYGREYYRANKERMAMLARRNRAINPERYRGHARKYRETNIDSYRVLDRLQQAKRRGWLRDQTIEKVDVQALIDRDGLDCHICGKPVPRDKVSIDHLIPLSKGGPHVAWNLSIAHRLCNTRRGPGRIPAQLHLL